MKDKMKKEVTKSLKVLFADDEIHLQELIAAELPRMGHVVTVCPDGQTAVAAIEEDTFDCIIVDLDMPGMNGIEVIQRTKELSPTTEAIVLTGKGSTETAISALRLGTFEYLQKPCKLVDLKSLLQRVAQRRELNNKIHALKLRLNRVEGEPTMIGSHRSMQRVKALIEKVAPTQSTVLVIGETGTGKELAARAVHEQSDRAEKPFVAINSATYWHALRAMGINDQFKGQCFSPLHGVNSNTIIHYVYIKSGAAFVRILKYRLPTPAACLFVSSSRAIFKTSSLDRAF